MKIIYTNHAKDKFVILEKYGWRVSRQKVSRTIIKPKWRGKSRFGQETAISLVNKGHVLRVIISRKSDKIKVITFHIARRGKYESTL